MRFIERDQNFAIEGDALSHFAGQAGGREQGRLVVHNVEDRRAVRARLLLHLVDAPEAFCHEQAGAHALAFEQRVRSDRRAVAEVADVLRGDALTDQQLYPRQDRPRRIVRRRGNLGDRDLVRLLVEIDEV